MTTRTMTTTTTTTRRTTRRRSRWVQPTVMRVVTGGVAVVAAALVVVVLSSSSSRSGVEARIPWSSSASASVPPPQLIRTGLVPTSLEEEDTEEEAPEDEDDARYSRQVYTVGARAQGAIRAATVYVVGPWDSGLVWETLKNLALSGIGQLILLTDDDDNDNNNNNDTNLNKAYHAAAWDDLGQMYRRGACTELGSGASSSSRTTRDLLLEYLRCLNPAMTVSTLAQHTLLQQTAAAEEEEQNNDDNEEETTTAAPPRTLLLCIDRPYREQVDWNRCCRRRGPHSSSSSSSRVVVRPTKFVAVETAGVYGRLFCDFGERHLVEDPDGERPLVIPLDHVELVPTTAKEEKAEATNTTTLLTLRLHNVDGEYHDVSQDDVVIFQGANGATLEDIVPCRVQTVLSPEKILVQVTLSSQPPCDNTNTNTNEEKAAPPPVLPALLVERIQREAISYSRQPQAQVLTFQSLPQVMDRAGVALLPRTQSSRSRSTTSRRNAPPLFTPCDFDKSGDATRRTIIFRCFQAMDCFVRKYGRHPRADDGPVFLVMLRAIGLVQHSCKTVLPDGPLGGEGHRRVVVQQAIDAFHEDDNDDQNHRSIADGGTHLDADWARHCSNFLKTCAAKFVPLQTMFGALAAQECLKAISGLYTPVQQFLLYDCDEVLINDDEDEEEEVTPTPRRSRDDTDASREDDATTGLAYILGAHTARQLRNQKLFVVGAGAIGCEVLKNLAAMGCGTGDDGHIVVTDMDTIETSNLSRQLLFRDADIGHFKSQAAAVAIQRFNPAVKIDSYTHKVGGAEETTDGGDDPFDSVFFAKRVNVILNALDNMEARLFMDGQCVTNKKAMIDAGTLGSKGNVQVVVPYQSESYGSSADPPERAIPVCTLKNFPYSISHTIQWGRDLFDGLFVRRPRQANQYAPLFVNAGVRGLTNKINEDAASDEAAQDLSHELSEDLFIFGAEDGTDRNRTKKMAIEWAIALGKELFHDTIQNLLTEHPIDKLDEDGERFWSGSRKPPKPLAFISKGDETMEDYMMKQQEEINSNMIDFVRSAARLRFETYAGIPSNPRDNNNIITVDEAKQAIIDMNRKIDELTPEAKNSASQMSKVDAITKNLAPLNSFTSSGKATSVSSLSAAEFEKDDDANDHISFITAASNLRAICYGIAPVDSMETRKVAGKIVPAMITTTAFVSALSCMELIKLAQGATLDRHRNAFINLALPFFAFTSPLPAEEFPGIRSGTHTLWDQITIKEGKKAAQSGGLTLRHLLKRIQKKAYKDDPDAVQVANISIGPYMLYANFLHEDDEDLLKKSIWQIIEDAMVSGEEFDQEFSRVGPTDGEKGGKSSPSVSGTINLDSFIDLEVVVEDTETFEEIELPVVRLIRSQSTI